MNWYTKVLKNYAVFNGRAGRKEYWMFVLLNFIFGLVAYLIDLSIGLLTFAVFGFLGFGLLYLLYTLAVFVPSLAVSVRRLHDVGKSGSYLLINLIPIVGPIWFLVLLCLPSDPGDNQYGSNPKEPEEGGEVIADYSRVIGLAHHSAAAYYRQGDAYDEMGEYDKAIAEYSEAIKLAPNHAAAYYNRALAVSKRGEVPKAVSDLERCIELSTDPKLIKDAKQVLFEMGHSSSRG